MLTIVAQKIIEHPTVDNERIITQSVPEGFNISRIKVLLDSVAGAPKVLVRQSSQQLYKLKIDEFCRRFEDKGFLGAANKRTFMGFLEGPMKTSSAWLECIEAEGRDLTPLVSHPRPLQYCQTGSNPASNPQNRPLCSVLGREPTDRLC